jgi:hypothetical protein
VWKGFPGPSQFSWMFSFQVSHVSDFPKEGGNAIAVLWMDPTGLLFTPWYNSGFCLVVVAWLAE